MKKKRDASVINQTPKWGHLGSSRTFESSDDYRFMTDSKEDQLKNCPAEPSPTCLPSGLWANKGCCFKPLSLGMVCYIAKDYSIPLILSEFNFANLIAIFFIWMNMAFIIQASFITSHIKRMISHINKLSIQLIVA